MTDTQHTDPDGMDDDAIAAELAEIAERKKALETVAETRQQHAQATGLWHVMSALALAHGVTDPRFSVHSDPCSGFFCIEASNAAGAAVAVEVANVPMPTRINYGGNGPTTIQTTVKHGDDVVQTTIADPVAFGLAVMNLVNVHSEGEVHEWSEPWDPCSATVTLGSNPGEFAKA